jgi:hypothetical protein
MTVARLDARMLEVTMNSPATARPPWRSRLALIVAGVLALLGSLVVTAPAQAGYYDDSYYGSNPCYDRCGYPRYRYVPPYRYNGCSPCGCYRRCHSYSRPGVVYERRYVEREYYERRYGYGGYGGYGGYRRHYGYNPYGGYGGYRRPYGYYGGYRRPFPWGYGGIRGRPYGYGYEPSAYTYEEPPRPPAPVWGGAGYEADPDGY